MVRAFVLMSLLAAVAGCDAAAVEPRDPPVEDPGEDRPPEPAPPPDASAPRIPLLAGGFAPSHARVAGADGAPIDVSLLADVELCEGCHMDVAAQWRSSAHGRSSFDNTWYRSAVDRFREQVSPEASRFCAGCHDPMLLLSGKIDQPEVSPEDPLAHAGITCLVCHSTQDARRDGNASWTVSTEPVPLPVEGDAASLAAHIERVRPDPLSTAQLCGTCHRVFLDEATGNPHFLPGLDDIGPWRGSAYAGSLLERVDEPIEEQRCQQCHMRDETAPLGDVAARGTGTVRSHRFPGGQTHLAMSTGDPEQLAAVRAQLREAAVIDVPAIAVLTNPARTVRHLPADGAPVRAGDRVALDVVVRNVGAGHAFPGGVRDTQDIWVKLVITDAQGRVVADAGANNPTGDDGETTHRLMTLMVDNEGIDELRHHPNRFAAAAYDHTVGPRGARVLRYEVELPRGLSRGDFPLRVEATLMHRRHNGTLQRWACDKARAPRGQRFLRASRERGRGPIDPCTPQPLTELARAAIHVGPGASAFPSEGGAARAAWRRLWDHALGVVGDVQERVGDAEPSIARGLERVEEDAESSLTIEARRGLLLAVRAELAARQNRAEDASAIAAEVEALIGPHPALHRIRGDAWARVWRWEEAARQYEMVTEMAPLALSGWRSLAQARGSLADDEGALAAAVRGLELQPRDEWLLRTQAVALEQLEHTGAAGARDAFVAYRLPDHAQELRFSCDRNVPHCARDRVPVPTITMRVR